MDIKTQKFLVMGMSKSGMAAATLLLSQSGTVAVYDESFQSNTVKENLSLIENMGGKVLAEEELDEASNEYDVLVLSPGVPIDHALAVQFKKSGKKIIGEMELGYRFLQARSIAVTGTNGKTTTVGMLESIFKQDELNGKTVSCGNVGTPLCSVVEGLARRDMTIIEVSSFQLETLNSIKSHVCIELCVTEDHLNRHYTMENYLFLKKKLLQNSMESEYVVLNYDDENVRNFAENSRAKIIWFSVKESVDGAYLLDNDLYYRKEKIIGVNELSVQGMHNISNALASIAAASIYGVPKEQITKGLREFKGIHHRIEKIAAVNGVTYINDSKATNADATIKAVECMTEETILLLGGKDKGYDYDKLFAYLQENGKVKCAVLYGENRFKLYAAAVKNDFQTFVLCINFDQAFVMAKLIVKSGQTILLSPASASFDEFSGYEERGEKFTELVKSLEAKEGERNAVFDAEE